MFQFNLSIFCVLASHIAIKLGWISIFPTSRLPPRWAILRWGILISRYINIAHPGYNTIFLSYMPLSRIQNSPNSIFDLIFHFWDQLNTFKNLTISANSQLSSWIPLNTSSRFCPSGGVGPINNHNLNMLNFLCSQGLHALSERFLAEEIEVEQIARLTDQDLISVGVTTIGGRMRIRSAAANRAPTLVSSIVLSLLQMIVFYVF